MNVSNTPKSRAREILKLLLNLIISYLLWFNLIYLTFFFEPVGNYCLFVGVGVIVPFYLLYGRVSFLTKPRLLQIVNVSFFAFPVVWVAFEEPKAFLAAYVGGFKFLCIYLHSQIYF